MTDEKDTSREGVKRHALLLAGVAFGIFATYVVYVYVFTLNN